MNLMPTPTIFITSPATGLNDPIVQHILTPIIQYAISPAIVIAVVVFILNRMFKFGELNKTIETAVKDIESLKTDGKLLLTNMTVIKTHLITTGGITADLFGPGSPLKLLEKGLVILNASGFKKTYEGHKKWFISEIKKHKVKTLADIDEAALKVMEKCAKEKKHANYKELAFQNGIPLDILVRILAIYLRDEVAKEILK